MEEKSNFVLWFIVGILFVIIYLLFDLKGVLKEIYSDTHYTSASVDHLENIENILEDIKRK